MYGAPRALFAMLNSAIAVLVAFFDIMLHVDLESQFLVEYDSRIFGFS